MTGAPHHPGPGVIHEVFEDVARRSPGKLAVTGPGDRLSYAELDRRANRLAHLLLRRGLTREQPVGVLLPPSPDYVVAVLAVLKAGGCYVPLEKDQPPARLAGILRDAGTRLVVTTGDPGPLDGYRIEAIPAGAAIDPGLPGTSPGQPAHPDQLAYVIHTSGSTGRPKGVLVRHAGLVRLVHRPSWLRLGPDEVIPLVTSITFDVSMFEIWGALLNGGTLVTAPSPVASVRSLGRTVREHGVTTMWLTAGLFHIVVDEGVHHLAGVRQLLAGGEAPSAQHVEKLLQHVPEVQFVNGYGPTEATVFATAYAVPRAGRPVTSVPMGAAVDGTTLALLDDDLRPVPDGTPGQLFIGGAGLARGYLGRPGLTAERFVPDPTGAGTRLYATGDSVLRRADGLLEFRGRIDRQVKVRGFRVEPGEIEAVIRAHPAVRDAVVVAVGERAEDRRLVAYPVFQDNPAGPPALAELTDWIDARLPGYLRPDVWQPLAQLPLTASGKVDRSRLPQPGAVTGS